jgi:hypothetical protein
MCLRRAPEKYIAGAALDRAVLDSLQLFNEYMRGYPQDWATAFFWTISLPMEMVSFFNWLCKKAAGRFWASLLWAFAWKAEKP